jgi:hypothetical protein
MIKNDTLNWSLKIAGFVMSIAIMVSSWFLNEAWSRINEVEKTVHKLEIESASVESNKFTNNDWAKAKLILDSERSDFDRRLIRLEESIPVIKDSLLSIKDSIKSIKP